ncbi:hypothetical protein J7376_11090 [Paracoccus sp. R12_1]|jgi:hypothetical protein|uniref:hypothetical protein n=1 Tax=unclassified Paracoccus (in: a-proteobacteria) TaxID=2688777 RepID=UPI001ADA2293|nr:MULTISPECIES: hypothetical protein [unclassified Paracoccus (in: a-proteobacteria)]MBO9456117.1 hypothetical protein [Paracoccus sp. R12_2]MBO9487066.1 hypothetical protein [Paracoccus sp. R12_1]
MNIPLAALLAFVGIFVTARFQRMHWLRATREEIRVRETKEATALVSDIATAFDKRIVAQRFLLLNLSDVNKDRIIDEYRAAVKLYSESYNEIRYRLFYYTSYSEVLYFENKLNNKIVEHGNLVVKLLKQDAPLEMQIASLDGELSIISTKVFQYCKKLSGLISEEKIGSLQKIYDWKDPKNEYISDWRLIKRLLNI